MREDKKMGKTYFISDLHLGAKYLRDPKATELRVVRFLDSIAADAERLYLVGDVLDYWYEYKNVVPRGYVRFLGKLAELADRGVKITWITGNHDVWLFDYLRDEIGLRVSTEPITEQIDGARFFLSHGDDVGERPRSYRFMRWCFYSKFCQTLYAGIHPRWTYPIATGWSKKNRTGRDPQAVRRYIDSCVGKITTFARDYVKNTDSTIDYFVFGHLHIARMVDLDEHRRILWLGDWISQFTYGVWDGTNLTLNHFTE